MATLRTNTAARFILCREQFDQPQRHALNTHGTVNRWPA